MPLFLINLYVKTYYKMISKKIWVPIYDYRIWYVEVEGPEDLPKLLKLAKKVNLGEENIKEIELKVKNQDEGGATTFHRKSDCSLFVIIYPQPSVYRREECISHEKRHCEDFILEHLGIDDKEAAAYLAGWLDLQFRY